uniref:Uncharacterized protein n=1 Tax=Setaria italica TaxID=4555 RepID=K3Z1I4_SETIT
MATSGGAAAGNPASAAPKPPQLPTSTMGDHQIY